MYPWSPGNGKVMAVRKFSGGGEVSEVSKDHLYGHDSHPEIVPVNSSLLKIGRHLH